MCSLIAFTSGDDAVTDAINTRTTNIRSFPGGSGVKHPPANAGGTGEMQLDPWARKIPWRRAL